MPKIPLKTLSKVSLRHNVLNKLRKSETEEKTTHFISSGSYNLNLALTGNIFNGYAIGRIANIKGAYSAGKTILGIEAINVVHYIEEMKKGKKVASRYNDAESALDVKFSKDLNIPEECEMVDPSTETVEEFHQDLFDFINRNKDKDICIYVLDSLDALMVREEQEEIKKNLNKIKKQRLKLMKEKKEEEEKEEEEKEEEEKISGSYGAQKAKYMSKFFRDIRNKLKNTNCVLIIISQLRDDLAKKYGDKNTTSSGRALGFWSTHRIDTRRKEILKKTKAAKNSYGLKAHLKVEKNKVYAEGREADIIFITKPAYGIDNYSSVIDYLTEYKKIPYSMGRYEWKESKYTKEKLVEYLENNPKDMQELVNKMQEIWNNIEEECSVKRGDKWKNILYE